MRDIDTAMVDSLKVLDPNRPIREADSSQLSHHVRFVHQQLTLVTFCRLCMAHTKAVIQLEHNWGHLGGKFLDTRVSVDNPMNQTNVRFRG